MAVYTDVAADELAEFLESYDVGELLSYKGIAEGVENSNFLLHTTSGYFILTLYEKRVAKNELPFFLGLMTHLASRGIICPEPLRNRSGLNDYLHVGPRVIEASLPISLSADRG